MEAFSIIAIVLILALVVFDYATIDHNRRY